MCGLGDMVKGIGTEVQNDMGMDRETETGTVGLGQGDRDSVRAGHKTTEGHAGKGDRGIGTGTGTDAQRQSERDYHGSISPNLTFPNST